MRFPLLIFAGLLCGAFSASVNGQNLLFRVRSGATQQLVTAGGVATVAATRIGATQTFQVEVTYQGGSNATLVRSDFAGSADYLVTSQPPNISRFPLGDPLRFTLTFRPSSSARNEAQLALTVQELAGDNQTILAQTVQILNISGTVPELGASLVSDQDGSIRRLNPNDTVKLPSSSATVAVSNRGTASGRLGTVVLSSPHFQLNQLPALPTAIDPGGELRFAIRYAPLSAGPHSAVLQMTLGDQPFNVTIEGSTAVSPVSTLRYLRVNGSSAVAIVPDTLISLGDVETGKRATAVVRVENSGTADSPNLAVATEGAQFSLAGNSGRGVITPGGSIEVTVLFEPLQTGPVEGLLRIGEAVFPLRGSGVQDLVTYRYESDSGDVVVLPGSRVFLQTTMPGRTLIRRFSIRNSGAVATTIPSIQLAGGEAGITLGSVPETPLTLAAGESASFELRFAPTLPGPASDVLLIGNILFDLAGTGGRPPLIPPYEIVSTLQAVEPARQGSVSLRLKEPYPLSVSGRLALRVVSNGQGIDPAVQFDSGGRSLEFKIAANTLNAIFEDGRTQIGFQTGTLAGTLVFSPSFSTAGETNITPEPPPALSLTVPSGPPALLSVRLIETSVTTASLVVNGFSTERSVTGVRVRLGLAGNEMQDYSIDVAALARTWFSNPQATQFGGLVSITIPFTAPRTAPRLQFAEVTAESPLGRSNTMRATLETGVAR